MKVQVTKMDNGNIISELIDWPDPTQNPTIGWSVDNLSHCLPVGEHVEVDWKEG